MTSSSWRGGAGASRAGWLDYQRTWPQFHVSFCGTGLRWDPPAIDVLDQEAEQVFRIVLTPGPEVDEVRILPRARGDG